MTKILEFFFQATSLQVNLGKSNLFQNLNETCCMVKNLTQIA